MAMDLRGVLRGECSECGCTQFVRPQTGAACANCHHVPARHKKLTKTAPTSSSSTLSASAVNSQAQLPQKRELDIYILDLTYARHIGSEPTVLIQQHNNAVWLMNAAHACIRKSFVLVFCEIVFVGSALVPGVAHDLIE